MVSYLFDLREQFARKEIARGLSGRVVVHELVRQGHCDADKARDLVSQLGPEVYQALNRRYGVQFTIGLFLMIATVYAVVIPNSPLLQFHPSWFLWVFAIAGPILTVSGWIGAHRFRAWTFVLDEVDGRASRLEGFTRQQLAAGRGEWWIVHEAGRLGLGDPDTVRAAIGRVWPEIYREYAKRRLSVFRIGLLVLAIGLAPVVGFGISANSFSDVAAVAFLMCIPLAIGIALTAYGWPGLRHRRDQQPAGLPGAAVGGPVRTGLMWRADPFEWK